MRVSRSKLKSLVETIKANSNAPTIHLNAGYEKLVAYIEEHGRKVTGDVRGDFLRELETCEFDFPSDWKGAGDSVGRRAHAVHETPLKGHAARSSRWKQYKSRRELDADEEPVRESEGSDEDERSLPHDAHEHSSPEYPTQVTRVSRKRAHARRSYQEENQKTSRPLEERISAELKLFVRRNAKTEELEDIAKLNNQVKLKSITIERDWLAWVRPKKPTHHPKLTPEYLPGYRGNTTFRAIELSPMTVRMHAHGAGETIECSIVAPGKPPYTDLGNIDRYALPIYFEFNNCKSPEPYYVRLQRAVDGNWVARKTEESYNFSEPQPKYYVRKDDKVILNYDNVATMLCVHIWSS